MVLTKKKAMKHMKQRCPSKSCGYCQRRVWLGKKWGTYLDVEQKEVLSKEVQVPE